MALFFIGYLMLITSTIGFIVAILTPRWIYPNSLPVDSSNPTSPNEMNYRGIFYVDSGYPNGTCRDWILFYKDSVSSCRPVYSIACASLSIISSSLSIILVWISAGYLYIRRRRLVPTYVTIITTLTLLIFCLTSIIWVVMITMNRDINLKIARENIGFSTWIAIGSSGGYLITFILFIIYRFNLSRRKQVKETNINSRRF